MYVLVYLLSVMGYIIYSILYLYLHVLIYNVHAYTSMIPN